VSASMKDFVPERAIVPRLFTRSALLMPMPESMIVRVLLVLSGMTWMNSSGCTRGKKFEKDGGCQKVAALAFSRRSLPRGFSQVTSFSSWCVLERCRSEGCRFAKRVWCAGRTWPSSLDLSVRPSKRILSSASEELLWVFGRFVRSVAFTARDPWARDREKMCDNGAPAPNYRAKIDVTRRGDRAVARQKRT
jgi:hypothetical protein